MPGLRMPLGASWAEFAWNSESRCVHTVTELRVDIEHWGKAFHTAKGSPVLTN